MKLGPDDYIREEKGQLEVRLSDPRGIIIQFKGSQMDFEKFMDRFKELEAYMKAEAKEWDEAMKNKPIPNIGVKP